MNTTIIIAMICWLGVIALNIAVDYHRIEIKKKRFNHRIWFLPVAVAGGLFLWWFMHLGVGFWAASCWIVFSYALLFNEGLNKARGKGFNYLGERLDDYEDALKMDKSLFDWFLQKVMFKYDFLFAAWAWFRVSGFLFSTVIMFHYAEGKY